MKPPRPGKHGPATDRRTEVYPKMKRWIFWLILVPIFAWFGRDGMKTVQYFREFRDKPPLTSLTNLK